MSGPKTGKFPRLPEDITKRTVFISESQDFKLLRASRLVVVKGADLNKELVVEKERVTIGRSSISDLSISDSSVSGLHCELLTGPSGHLLRDLGSTNGIFMLGHRVREVFLRPGSEFQVGNNLLRFESLNTMVKIPLSANNHFGQALGSSIKMREIFALLERVSTSDLAVLLRGETGTGKELLAAGIHMYSFRKNRPFIVLDCAATPADLIESTLFGHEKGAFTGAEQTRRGVFEQANGGTLFIDEVAELSLALQPKLLRVLEQQEVQRVGGISSRKVDVRIIAATHRDLCTLVDQGLFREDLFYRLSVVEVNIPPLRERPEDIPLLCEHLLEQGAKLRETPGRQACTDLDDDAMVLLQSHSWPGNVRELANVLERAQQLSEGDIIGSRDLQLDPAGQSSGADWTVDWRAPYKEAKAVLLSQFERRYLIGLMDECDGNLSLASRKAGLARHHVRNLCRKYLIRCGADSD
jgi:DNA-binding NtrC family response regulator